jgi:tetratricopeptide (TPR) repeat protein
VRWLVKRENPALKKLALAAEAGKTGNYRKAEKILGELITESEAPPEAWLLLGRALHGLKDYSRALAAFNDYLKLRPGSSQGYLFAGRTYLALGLPYKAVPLLRKALDCNPLDLEVMALLGIAYLKSKHSQAAVDLLQKAVEAAPNSRRIYRAYLNALLIRGIRLCRLEDYDMGLRMLCFVLENGREIDGFVDAPLLRLELGRACRETGRYEEALEHYSKALEYAPEDRRIRWSRVQALMALGKNREALGEIDIIRSREPGLPELPWNSELVDLFVIDSSIQNGEWRRAAEACKVWLRTRQNSGLVHAYNAEALRNLGEYQAAHNHLLRAREENPEKIEYWYQDILVSWEAQDWASLKKALRGAKKLGGDRNIIKRFSVLLEAKTEKDDNARLFLLQNAVRSLGPEPELMYELGNTNLKIGLLDQARSWFRKTIRLMPDHEEARLGEIAALEHDLASGMDLSAELHKAYNAYLKRWPDNFNIRRERALFLVRTCEYGKAAGELEKLLVFEPANPSLRRVLSYTYRKTGRYREAAVFLKTLLKEKPHDIEMILEYSGCLERSGAVHYAEAVLEKASELFKKSPELFLALGILYFRQKKTDEAYESLRKAALLNAKDPRPFEWMAVIARKSGDYFHGDDYEKEARKRK